MGWADKTLTATPKPLQGTLFMPVSQTESGLLPWAPRTGQAPGHLRTHPGVPTAAAEVEPLAPEQQQGLERERENTHRCGGTTELPLTHSGTCEN